MHPYSWDARREPITTAMARASGARRRRAHERVRGMNEVPKAPSESAGEGVAGTGARVSQSCVGHTASATSVRNRLGRVWLEQVPVCLSVIPAIH